MALISAGLALICLGLAIAWQREHDEAACWRAAAEDNQIPPEGDCHYPLLPHARATKP